MKFSDEFDIYQFGKYHYRRINRVSADGCHLIPLGEGFRHSGKSVPGTKLVWQGTWSDYFDKLKPA